MNESTSISSLLHLPSAHIARSRSKEWLREWSILLTLLCVAFVPVLIWMYERWVGPDSYTSHGFLVPLISGYFIYQQRKELIVQPRQPSLLGLALLCLGMVIFISGGLLRVYFTSGFALVICLAGMLIYWGGWNWLRQLWFPLLFLVFMLPLPEIAIARVNLALKLQVTHVAVSALDLCGVPVVMDGATIHLENGDLVVGDVCSGLRSIIALIALGALFTYSYGKRAWIVKGSLLAAILPAAIGANVIRIFLNVLFVYFFGKEPLFRPLASLPFAGIIDLHLLSGFVVFAFALLALWITLKAAERCQHKIDCRREPVDSAGARIVEHEPRPVQRSRTERGFLSRQGMVMSCLLSGLCLLSFTRLYQEPPLRSSGKLSGFPQQIGSWKMIADYPPSAKEIELLETENITSRVYRDPEGHQIALVLVYDPSGNRKMAHPQEICLRADGLDLLSNSAVRIQDTDIEGRRLLMERADRRMLYYYWYKAGAYQSGNYIQSQLRLALQALGGHQSGTALVRISTNFTRGNENSEEAAVQAFAKALQPDLERYLP